MIAAFTPSPAPGVFEGTVDGTRVLFNSSDRRLHVLNHSAESLWDGLRQPTTVVTLIAEVAAAFGVDPSVIRVDAERTLDQLVADGLAGQAHQPPPVAAPPAFVTEPKGAPAVTIAALGTTIGLHVESPTTLAAITRITGCLEASGVADAWIRLGEDGGRWTVTSSLGTCARTGSRLAAVLRSISEINSVAVAGCDDQLVFHAAAVASANRAVLLPGPSNRGKSTLTTALVQADYGYLTDEAAAVDSDGVVHPFAKAIALDPGSFPLFPRLAPQPRDSLESVMALREWHVDPRSIGSISTSAPVAAIVCPRWQPGSSVCLSRVDTIEAVHTLLGDTFDFVPHGNRIFDILLDLVGAVPGSRLRSGALEDGVAAVGRVLANS